MAVTASMAKADLLSLIEQVIADRTAVEIVSNKGSGVLISLAEYEALQETAYLVRTPANSAHLLDSIAQRRSGAATQRELVD